MYNKNLLNKNILLWILCILCISSFAFADLTDDNLVYLAFDDVSVPNYTMVGVTDAVGKIESALSFDGVDNYVNIDYPLGMKTWSLWLYGNAYEDARFLNADDGGANRNFYGVTRDPEQDYRLCFKSSSNVWACLNSEQPFVKDQWNHIVIVKGTDNMYFYLNGNTTPETWGGSFTLNEDTGAPLQLGDRNTGSPTSPFNGNIDDFRIYNESLSGSQIAELYNSGSGTEAETIDPSNLIFHADMNTLQDDAGNTNSDVGNEVEKVEGVVGPGALEFNGVDEYIDTNYDLTGITGNTLTYSAWFKNNDTRINIIMSTISAAPTFQGHEIYINNGILNFFIGNDLNTGNYNLLLSTAKYNDNQWHHVVSVYNNSYNASDMNIYVDGSPIVPVINKNDLTATPFGTENVTIGVRPIAVGTYWFNGTIDEVGVWDKALSADEVLDLYTYGNPYAGRITIDINSPANDTYSDTPLSVNFNITNENVEPTNCSLYINDVLVNSTEVETLCFQQSTQNISRQCFQENADHSDGTDTVNCGLNYDGTYTEDSDFFYNGVALRDRNYGTWTELDGNVVGEIIGNWTKPTLNNIESMIFRIKLRQSSVDVYKNYTIPSSCFNYYTDKVRIKVYAVYFLDVFELRCYSGSWELITQEGATDRFYEDGVYWNVADNSRTQDGSCDINYSGDYNILNDFNDGNYTTYEDDELFYNINYHKPDNSSAYKAVWNINTGSYNCISENVLVNYSLEIPESCYSQNSDYINLTVNNTDVGGPIAFFSCYNGIGYTLLGSRSTECGLGGGTSIRLYEEDVNWGINQDNYTNIELSYVSISEGLNTWYLNCSSDTIDPVLTQDYIYYYDDSDPNIVTTFLNNSLGYRNNLTGNFTITDNVLLHTVNVSIDGAEIFSQTNINNASFNYSLNIDALSYGVGAHTLSVRVADGHTAKELKDYSSWKVKDGLFNNKIKYEFKKPYNEVSIEIIQKEYSVLDTWNVIKKKDRYSEVFEPFNKKNQYTFIVTSDNPIYIVTDKEGRYGGSWLVIDEHWKDFVVKDYPEVKPVFKRISEYEVEVTLKGLKDVDVIEFESTGDLNIITKNYTFFAINMSETYDSILLSGYSSTYYLDVHIGNSSFTTPQLTYPNSGAGVTLNGSGLGLANYYSLNDTDIVYKKVFSGYTTDTQQVIPHNWTWISVPLGFSGVTPTQNQTLYPIFVGVCNASLTHVIANISYFDEVSGAAINLTNNYDLTIYDGTYYYNINGTFSGDTSNSICTNLDPAIVNYSWSMWGQMIVEKDDYITKTLTTPEPIAYVIDNDPFTQINLYMIAVNDSTTVKFNWLTTTWQEVDGTMRIYECGSNATKILVDSIPIISGVGYGNIQLLTQAYAYDIIYQDTLYRDSDSYYQCHIESSTERTYYISAEEESIDGLVGLNTLKCRLTRYNDSSVQLKWSSNNQEEGYVQGCVKQVVSTITGKTTIFENCTSESEGYNKIWDLTLDGNSNIVTAYVTQDGKTAQCMSPVTFSPTTEAQGTWGISGLLAAFFIICFLMLVFSENGETMLGIGGLGLVVVFFLGILYLSWMSIISLILFMIIIAIIGRYSRKRG